MTTKEFKAIKRFLDFAVKIQEKGNLYRLVCYVDFHKNKSNPFNTIASINGDQNNARKYRELLSSNYRNIQKMHYRYIETIGRNSITAYYYGGTKRLDRQINEYYKSN